MHLSREKANKPEGTQKTIAVGSRQGNSSSPQHTLCSFQLIREHRLFPSFSKTIFSTIQKTARLVQSFLTENKFKLNFFRDKLHWHQQACVHQGRGCTALPSCLITRSWKKGFPLCSQIESSTHIWKKMRSRCISTNKQVPIKFKSSHQYKLLVKQLGKPCVLTYWSLTTVRSCKRSNKARVLSCPLCNQTVLHSSVPKGLSAKKRGR